MQNFKLLVETPTFSRIFLGLRDGVTLIRGRTHGTDGDWWSPGNQWLPEDIKIPMWCCWILKIIPQLGRGNGHILFYRCGNWNTEWTSWSHFFMCRCLCPENQFLYLSVFFFFFTLALYHTSFKKKLLQDFQDATSAPIPFLFKFLCSYPM